MALENRIESLKKKHAYLDQKLREAEAHHADDLVLSRIKSDKLGVKDQIERLLHTNRAAA